MGNGCRIVIGNAHHFSSNTELSSKAHASGAVARAGGNPGGTNARRRRGADFLAAACVAALCGAVVRPAAAQTLDTPLAPGAGALIIDQQRQDRQPLAPPPAAAPPLPAPAAQAPVDTAPATPLREIRVRGGAALGARLSEINARFAGRPLDAETIRAAADAVSAAYADVGLALYTVAVPRQDLGQGVLTLVAVEGHIAQVDVSGDLTAREKKLIEAYGAKLTRERPLTRASLERYLSLMRDIPGITVDAQLYNLPAAGAVRLAVVAKIRHFQPELAVNNRGTPRLGTTQVQATLTGRGLFQAGDQAQVSAAVPTDIDRFQYVGAAYGMPLGTEGLTLQLNASYLRTRPKSPPIAGDAASAGMQLAYPIIRGYNRNLIARLGLDGLNSDNAIYGLSITSDHTRALRGSLGYSVVSPRRTFSANVIGSLGLDGLGARADTRLTDADFKKLNVQVAFNQAIGKVAALRLRGLAQLSHGRLPAAEQLPLGGEQVGRAFYSAIVVGDRGYGGSAELALITPKPWPTVLKGSEVYAFVDGGRARVRARLPYAAAADYDLASAGAGVRFLIKGKNVIGLEGARSLDTPYPGQGDAWRVIISWRFQR